MVSSGAKKQEVTCASSFILSGLSREQAPVQTSTDALAGERRLGSGLGLQDAHQGDLSTSEPALAVFLLRRVEIGVEIKRCTYSFSSEDFTCTRFLGK